MPRNSPLTASSSALAVRHVAQAQALHFLFLHAQHLFDHGVGAQLDLGMRHGALQHDLRGAEGVAPVQQRHLGGEPREEHRLFHRRIAAAHHGNLLVAEEESVARRATRHAVADQRLFAGQSQPARARARGHNQRARRESRRPRYAAGWDARPPPPSPGAHARYSAPNRAACFFMLSISSGP